ncbi:hypothetical protein [Microbulbifer sp. JSM ZJ756]|uniref:hypothetical protein n=1 Tax=Microbulbifer sp. JSM ZJ756 TaxID=3376191 RepID=UPI0037B35CBD
MKVIVTIKLIVFSVLTIFSSSLYADSLFTREPKENCSASCYYFDQVGNVLLLVLKDDAGEVVQTKVISNELPPGISLDNPSNVYHSGQSKEWRPGDTSGAVQPQSTSSVHIEFDSSVLPYSGGALGAVVIRLTHGYGGNAFFFEVFSCTRSEPEKLGTSERDWDISTHHYHGVFGTKVHAAVVAQLKVNGVLLEPCAYSNNIEIPDPTPNPEI